MDVFLGEKVDEITLDELRSKLNANELLIIERKRFEKDKELSTLIKNKKRYPAVNYYIVVLR